jgi:hypothetical protein
MSHLFALVGKPCYSLQLWEAQSSLLLSDTFARNDGFALKGAGEQLGCTPVDCGEEGSPRS